MYSTRSVSTLEFMLLQDSTEIERDLTCVSVDWSSGPFLYFLRKSWKKKEKPDHLKVMETPRFRFLKGGFMNSLKQQKTRP